MSSPPEARGSSSASLAAVEATERPMPTSLEEVALEQRRLRALMQRQAEENRAERREARLRHQAIMDILRDVLARLPETS